jgi:hypothetical protein
MTVGFFSWEDYRPLLAKAERDLAAVRESGAEDDIFDLVVTIDHVWDWVSRDDRLPSELRIAADTLHSSNGDPNVWAIHGLSIGAKHFAPVNPAATELSSETYGWGDAPWGSSPWGGGYFVEVEGDLVAVDSVAERAIARWRSTLGYDR